MVASRPPRRPPRPRPAAAPSSNAAFLEHSAPATHAAHAAADEASAEGVSSGADAWRGELDALRAAGTLDDAQETALHRLFGAQTAELSEVVPALLDAFQRDLAAHGPDRAKQALTAALQAVKDRQREDTLRMLASFGADVSELRR